jgi:polysaccharide biosynthesis protein PslF
MANISDIKTTSSRGSLKIPSLKDKRIAILSTYVPRKCGIGAYTKDLADNINLLNPTRPVEIIAMDGEDENSTLVYPSEVSRVIRQNQWQDYVDAAAHINSSILDLVIIQHEFGIFGGSNGALIVDFVKLIEKPIIITLHTILKCPTAEQEKIINQLSRKAQKVFVMLPSAADTLVKTYRVSRSKIEMIPLGTPNFSFITDTSELKTKLDLKNKIVMSSINFVSKGKGFEHVISALPEIAKKFPNFIYLIIGQTHPVVLKREGEIYRTSLEEQVAALGLQNNVKFINQYVSAEEAHAYIQLSDFYITPYDSLEQISSASLSYAIAADKICISTAFRYASENLSGAEAI